MPLKIPDAVNTAVAQQRIARGELDRVVTDDVGAVHTSSQLDVTRQDPPVDAHTAVVGDASSRAASQRQEIGGGLSVRLGADAASVLFSDLPKAIQQEIKDHIEAHNAGQRASFSPQNLEFLRASERGGAFDVTFAVRDFTGKVSGERSARFGEAAPVPPPAPTVSGASITALDQLPAAARTAIEAHLEAVNEGEQMSMSPKTFTFVSAAPMSDGGFEVTLHAASMFGDGDDEKHKLGADGRFR